MQGTVPDQSISGDPRLRYAARSCRDHRGVRACRAAIAAVDVSTDNFSGFMVALAIVASPSITFIKFSVGKGKGRRRVRRPTRNGRAWTVARSLRAHRQTHARNPMPDSPTKKRDTPFAGGRFPRGGVRRRAAGYGRPGYGLSAAMISSASMPSHMTAPSIASTVPMTNAAVQCPAPER